MNRSPLGKEITKFEEDLFFSLFPAKENQTFSEDSIFDLLSPPKEISMGSSHTDILDADCSFDEEPPISGLLNEDKVMGEYEGRINPLQTSGETLSETDEQNLEPISLNVEELYMEAKTQMYHPGDRSPAVIDNSKNFHIHKSEDEHQAANKFSFRNDYRQSTEDFNEMNPKFPRFTNNSVSDSSHPSNSLTNAQTYGSKEHTSYVHTNLLNNTPTDSHSVSRSPFRHSESIYSNSVPILTINSDPPCLNLKGSYNDYMSKYRNGQIPKDWTGKWPKYIGSMVVDCLITERKSLANIMLHDEVTFKPEEIRFSNQHYVRGRSLEVQCLWNDQSIGHIQCEYEEAFALLLTNNYLILDGCIVVPPAINKYNIQVQINVFLTDQVIKNPLNSIPTDPSQTIIKKLKSSEINKAEYQTMRLSKQSLVKVFELLKIKISIPSLIQVKHRFDPLKKIQDDKWRFQGHRTVQTISLIISDFPDYYASEPKKYNYQGDIKSFSQRAQNDQIITVTSNNEANQDLFNIVNQVTSYYKEAETPPTLKSELQVYQKQALSWMLFKEGKKESKDLFSQGFEEQRKLNDLFQEMILIDGSMLYFNPFSGEISVDFPELKVCKGGILADEMGLGKTVMMIALMHANKREIQPPVLDVGYDTNNFLANSNKREADKFGMIAEEEYNISDEEEHKKLAKTKKLKLEEGYIEDANKYVETNDLSDKENSQRITEADLKKKHTKLKVSNSNNNKDFYCYREHVFNDVLPIRSRKKAGTLIVLPVTVLSQWESEIRLHSNPGTLTVSRYYGERRDDDRLQNYDVILTTYGLLGSEFNRCLKDGKDVGVFRYEWHRIILDEAHIIKSRLTKTAKAVCSLISDYRWCVTGTPLQNKLDDMFSLFQFLRMETWGEYFWWNTYVNKHSSSLEAENLIRSIIKPMLLRRTKKSTYLDGRDYLTVA